MDSFVEILLARTQQEPEACAFAFLAEDGAETRLTYTQLQQRASSVAAQLQEIGAAGEPVLIILQPGLDYVVALFACILAGSIMVPCASLSGKRAGQLCAIAVDSGAKFAIGCLPFIDEHSEFPPVQWITPEAPSLARAAKWRAPNLKPDHIALLQYTSGSTSSPRGVMVSHGNLIENARSIAENFQHPKELWGVTWLPPYHDMGLMGGLLQPVYFGAPSAVISPLDFARRPMLWLETISRYRARTSGGPNVAYEFCARIAKPEEVSTLHLESWELAYIGGEPVRANTLDLFAEKFAPSGFKRDSFFPCYGLAEATLYVSGGRPCVRHLSAAALSENRAVETQGKNADTRAIVGGGRPACGLTVSIIDPQTELRCESGSIGEIWVSGASVANGYWHQPQETKLTFQAYLDGSSKGPYLRTGDLGFLQDGELFVTGRSKDLIIVSGRNHYPHDIESTVTEVSQAIRPGSCAAFSVDCGTEEKLVLVIEMPRPRPENLGAFAGDIRQAVVRSHEVQVSSILLVRPGAIPMTTSGKVQRLLCRLKYESGALEGQKV
jgi:acyl-CoA synthetase (AMP-forming)/AMP-acid ligase II